MADQMTSRQVLAALYRHFSQRWAMLTEVSAATFERSDGVVARGGRERRIDALLIRRQGASVLERVAIEVKVSRADFLSDVRNPAKQAPWRELAHRHTYAVPLGLVSAIEVPADSGLLTVRPTRHDPAQFVVEWARRAPKRPGAQVPDLPLPLVMDAFWRAARAEASLKGLHHRDDSDATEEDLRGQIKALQHRLTLESGSADRARDQATYWRLLYARHDPPPCASCGKPLYPAKLRSHKQWEHRDPAVEAACKLLRRAEDGEFRWVPDPQPIDIDVVSASLVGASTAAESRAGRAAHEGGEAP